jgi:high-affinity nickel permease
MNFSLLAPLALGFLLGLRHALDADHVAAVTTILSRESKVSRSILIGMFWGLGHTVSLFLVGGLIIGFKVMIPESISNYFEAGVGVMLVFLGLDLLRKLAKSRTIHTHVHSHDGVEHHHAHMHEGDFLETHDAHEGFSSSRRPFFVGLIHGLAGSASIVLFLLPALPSVLLGIVVLALFSAGMMLSMAVLAWALTVSFHFVSTKSRACDLGVSVLTGVASIGFGLFLIWE